MPHSIKALSKNKRLLAILSFFVVSQFFLPAFVSAQIPVTDVALNSQFIVYLSSFGFWVFRSLAEFALQIGAVKFLLPGLIAAIRGIFYYLALYSAYLFDVVLAFMVKDIEGKLSITNTGSGVGARIFLGAWQTTRNWADMLIVIGIIGIAIATILRFREYEARKLLAPFLIVALLINFSGVFVGLLIDVSNATMGSLLARGTFTSNPGEKMIIDINKAREINIREFTIPEYATYGVDQITVYAGLSGVFILMYLITGLTLLGLSVLFIQRYTMLAILFILSPLAFLMGAFPFAQARSLWNNWWTRFLHWCFAGVIATFLLQLAFQMQTINLGIKGLASINNPSTTPSAQLMPIIFKYVIVLTFMFIALRMTKQSSELAKFVIEGASKLTKVVLAAGAAGLANTAAGAARLTGLSESFINAKDYFSDTFASVRERLPGGIAGTKETRAKARVAARMKKYANVENIQSTARLVDIVQNGRDAAERAKAFEVLMKRNKLYEIPEAARQAAFDNALRHSIEDSDIRKSAFEFAPYDKEFIKKVAEANPNLNPDEVKTRATRLQLQENLPNMSFAQIAKIDHQTAISPIDLDFITSDQLNPGTIRRKFSLAPPALRAHLKSFINVPPGAPPGTVSELDAAINGAPNQREAGRLQNIRQAIDDLPN